MTSRVLIILLIMLFSCIGEPDDTPEHLLKTCFNAIKADDWEGFKSYVVTGADIMQKEMGVKVSKFKQKLTYTGGVLKPEQLKAMKEKFERARSSGAGFIDFSAASFIGMGKQLPFPTSYRSSVIYSIRIKDGSGQIVDTDSLYPQFEVMPWDDRWRLVGMIFPEESPAK